MTDDHPSVISGIINLLSPARHIHVIGAYPNGAALMEGLVHNKPDVLLLDIFLPDKHAYELIPIIKRKYPDIRILILTVIDEPGMVELLLRKGCVGYLLKGAGPDLLVQAIETVFRNQQFVDAPLKEQMLQNVMKRKTDIHPRLFTPLLTQREKEIITLMAQELTMKEISEKLFISHDTAENHRYNLIQKLDAKNTEGLVKVAKYMGLI